MSMKWIEKKSFTFFFLMLRRDFKPMDSIQSEIEQDLKFLRKISILILETTSIEYFSFRGVVIWPLNLLDSLFIRRRYN